MADCFKTKKTLIRQGHIGHTPYIIYKKTFEKRYKMNIIAAF